VGTDNEKESMGTDNVKELARASESSSTEQDLEVESGFGESDD
jgi:hypothetical protein